ncbi:MAG: hypothetical protein NTV06_10375, partial [candidate division Zixibacteria bacterium]|nr:hypothetical protein [candidate division Zixibacteria bacterium]
DTSRIFNIGKYYRREIKTDSLTIYFNRKQYLDRYFEEIDRMAGSLFIRPDMAGQGDRYSTYTAVKINLQSGARQPEFLSGLDPLKLSRMIAKYVGGSYSRSLIDQNRDNYIQYLQKARRQTGNTRIESLMIALSMFQKMRHQYLSDKGASASSPFGKFLDRTIAQVTAVIFKEAGIKQKGETLIRDSSEGRKLKFISEIDNDGPNEITCGPLTFKPYWLDTAITIDVDRTTILPYNSFIKEYLVPVQPYQLETFQPESLLFSGRIEFKNNPFDFRYSLNTYEKSPLKIEFAPYFIVIKPFPKLQVDRLVEPAGITLLIRKPSSYA